MDGISNSNLIEISDKEVQYRLLSLLDKFHQFCKENNINYSITSGTFLGAIRHNGFIPWDDDIDVGLTRKEYEKLLDAISKHTNELYFIGAELNNGIWPFIKLIDKTTIIKENGSTRQEYLWIDIFPFDNSPLKIFPKVIHLTTKRILVYKINDYLGIQSLKTNSFLKKIYNNILYKISKNISIKSIALKHIKVSSIFQNKKMNYVGDIIWGTKPIPRYLFDDLVDYQFENITVKGFKEYDTYLTCIYGDYMKLPPEDQRVNHGIKAWRVNSDEE